MIGYDVETDGFQWYAGHQAFLYAFDDDEGHRTLLRPETDGEKIQGWLNRGAAEGIEAWNSAFDLHFAEAAGFTLPPESSWHDGMITAHVIDERRSVALKNVGEQLFGPETKDTQKAVHGWLKEERARRKKAAKEAGEELVEPNFSDVPNEIIEPYAEEDVILTRRVREQYAPVLAAAPDLANLVEFEREVLAAKYAMEQRGFPVDEGGYRRLEIELIENLEKLEDNCKALAGSDDFNCNSSPQLYQALKARGANLQWVTGESMDKENLATVDDELARAILAFRAEYKALSTYVRPMVGRHYETRMRSWKEQFIQDGRVHANYRQVGAKTGRFSCSDPNIQNQPRDDLRLRYNFRAEPGQKLVTVDLAGIEMRLFVAFAGGGRMLDAIREGRDVHEMTARDIGIRERKRAEGVIESARQRGKTFNYSQLFGGGGRTIRKQLGCSMDQARVYRNRYADAYPEIVRLKNRIEWRLQDIGYLQSPWGRRFRVDPRDAYLGVAHLVQGSAGDLLKASLIRLHKEGIPVVAVVHDEVIAAADEKDAEEVKVAITRALTEHERITEKVPLEADGAIVDRWSQAKDPEFVPRFAQ